MSPDHCSQRRRLLRFGTSNVRSLKAATPPLSFGLLRRWPSLFGGDSARSADAFPAGAEEKVTFVVDVEKDATPEEDVEEEDDDREE